jgi:hypothetical protein
MLLFGQTAIAELCGDFLAGWSNIMRQTGISDAPLYTIRVFFDAACHEDRTQPNLKWMCRQ